MNPRPIFALQKSTCRDENQRLRQSPMQQSLALSCPDMIPAGEFICRQSPGPLAQAREQMGGGERRDSDVIDQALQRRNLTWAKSSGKERREPLGAKLEVRIKCLISLQLAPHQSQMHLWSRMSPADCGLSPRIWVGLQPAILESLDENLPSRQNHIRPELQASISDGISD